MAGLGCRSDVGAMRRIRVFLSVTISAIWAFSDVADAPFRLTTAMAQSQKSEMPFAFDIPAQPLSSALATYGAATGLDVFYDADLAEKQRSTDVAGTFSPAQALDLLLLGTGYVARSTGAGVFTILRAPRTEAADLPSPIDPRIYGSYFATIQARVSDALCAVSGMDSKPDETLFRFWLAPSGTVVRAEVIADNGDLLGDQGLAAAIHGLAIGVPPAGMPQPVNLVILPPSASSRLCRLSRAKRSRVEGSTQ
jgi:hypothetical protein